MIEIIVALVGCIGSIVAVTITNRSANNKMLSSLEASQRVTDERIDELTREVRMHNDFAIRIPVMEQKIEVLEERVKELQGLHKRRNGD